ncbi:6719_t:CDS:2 [Racocetra persica]|uniref:6719_t:CDS:1 n=1 Tax=Racocetra persica TaxID=160502 RepID=A0ACA9LLS6_9GLOM|nr:6719_t:CDS:2 [Racocetra persica]
MLYDERNKQYQNNIAPKVINIYWQFSDYGEATPTTPTQQLQQGQFSTVDYSEKKRWMLVNHYIRKAFTQNEKTR